MKVIFLDFDGVMNSREWCYANSSQYHLEPIDPKSAAVLDQIIEKTAARIVISSVWRADGVGACKRYLAKAGFKNHASVISRTGNGNLGRGAEIEDWLEESKSLGYDITHYVILDDDVFDMGTQLPKTVWIDRESGLTEAHLPSIYKHLEG